MTTEKLNTKELFKQSDEATTAFINLFSSVDEDKIYVVPFEDSWTVAQLVSHVTKSIKAITQSLNMPGKPAERNAGERVGELKKIFLDYNVKYKSPDFILPTKETYSKQEILSKLESAVEQLQALRNDVNYPEVISLPAFGEITKFELLNFITFHTVRHTHQLNNILYSLNKN